MQDIAHELSLCLSLPQGMPALIIESRSMKELRKIATVGIHEQ
jgi:hypothetical protein